MHGLPDDARCLDCGYALRGQTEPRCPECGREFDPANAKTFPRQWTWWRRFSGPPRTWHIVLTVLAGLCALIGDSGPGGPFSFAFPIGCIGLHVLPVVLVVDYLARLVVCITHRSNSSRRVAGWRWAILPVAALLLASATLYPWPLRVRFALSRPALEAEIQRLRVIPQQDPNRPVDFPRGPSLVGSYTIIHRRVARDTSGAVTRIELATGGFLFGTWGFSYNPRSTAPSNSPALPLGWSVYIDEK